MDNMVVILIFECEMNSNDNILMYQNFKIIFYYDLIKIVFLVKKFC